MEKSEDEQWKENGPEPIPFDAAITPIHRSSPEAESESPDATTPGTAAFNRQKALLQSGLQLSDSSDAEYYDDEATPLVTPAKSITFTDRRNRPSTPGTVGPDGKEDEWMYDEKYITDLGLMALRKLALTHDLDASGNRLDIEDQLLALRKRDASSPIKAEDKSLDHEEAAVVDQEATEQHPLVVETETETAAASINSINRELSQSLVSPPGERTTSPDVSHDSAELELELELSPDNNATLQVDTTRQRDSVEQRGSSAAKLSDDKMSIAELQHDKLPPALPAIESDGHKPEPPMSSVLSQTVERSREKESFVDNNEFPSTALPRVSQQRARPQDLTARSKTSAQTDEHPVRDRHSLTSTGETNEPQAPSRPGDGPTKPTNSEDRDSFGSSSSNVSVSSQKSASDTELPNFLRKLVNIYSPTHAAALMRRSVDSSLDQKAVEENKSSPAQSISHSTAVGTSLEKSHVQATSGSVFVEASATGFHIWSDTAERGPFHSHRSHQNSALKPSAAVATTDNSTSEAQTQTPMRRVLRDATPDSNATSIDPKRPNLSIIRESDANTSVLSHARQVRQEVCALSLA